MNDDRQPWWASADGAPTSTEDPIVAHRAARRGPSTPNDTATPTNEATAGPAGGADAAPPPAHADAICGVCPICVLARTLGDTHPELLGHLTEAARHLAAAARAMLDPSPQDDAGTDGVQRIDLD